MTFGALPFLLAALAAAIPVVLHMINRQKAQDLPFSTLRFLRISVEKTRRRKRIHDVLLMLLRMAVLILIAIGLAKPTLTNLSALWGGGSSAVAIILDNSASMGTIDHGRVRFRTALGAAGQIMDELRDGDEVALLLTGGPKIPEEGKLDRTHEKVLQMLQQWVNSPTDTGGISYQQADLAMKIEQARKLLRESEATDKQIYVLSDLQKLCFEGLEKEAVPDEPLGKEEQDIRNVPIIFVDCNRTPKPNVAVTAVELKSTVPIAGQPIIATVELLCTSSVEQQRHVALYVDGKEKHSSVALKILPGERRKYDIKFTVERGGSHRGEVQLVGKDGCALDDRRFFTMDVDQGIPVAVVKAQRHEIPYLEDTFYLEQALSGGKTGSWALRTNTLTAVELAAEPLADYKVIFCVNLPALPGPTAARLAAYVAGGGNLVWICGDNVEAEAYKQMNDEAGNQLLPAPLLGLRTPDAAEDRDSWNVGFLDKQHAALGPLVEPASLYRSVLIYKHMRMDAAGGRVLARLDDEQGEPLLVQRNVDQGRVLMLGTSVHIGWSNLPLRPIFLPLLVRLTFDLAEAEQTRHETFAGSPLLLPLEDETAPVHVEVLVPTGETIRPTLADAQPTAAQTFRYDDTHEIGIYQLRLLPPARPRQIAISVNADPDESDPAKISRKELETRLGPTPLVFAEDPEDLSSTFTWLREGKSLWGLFLTCVLIALVFETFLANRLSPKQDEDQTQQPPPGMRRLARKGRGAA